jgi:hypothetical protein
MNRNLVGSTYGKFCIKFPQNRMKDERHRLSPLSIYEQPHNVRIKIGNNYTKSFQTLKQHITNWIHWEDNLIKRVNYSIFKCSLLSNVSRCTYHNVSHYTYLSCSTDWCLKFCIKFPQNRMKDERHRLSPLSI